MDAILTRLTKLTDTSLIVHWFTAEEGRIKTVAKGARRPSSPFAGKLDLFFSAEIRYARARTGELHPLREASPTHLRENIRKSYDATDLGAYFCRLLEITVEPEHPEPEVFDLLRRGLDHLHTAGPSARALLHFEHEVARMLGLAHERRHAAPALRESLGSLPPQRAALLDRLR